jgi:hypothetical protein
MDRTEVLAIEVKQFVGQGLTGLVPRVIGRTAEAQRVKVPGERAQRKDEASFFQAMEENRSIQESDTARRILDWSKLNFSYINWGRASFSPVLECNSAYSHNPIGVYTSGQVEIKFRRMKYRIPAFQSDDKRLELVRRLNEISGVNLPADCIGKFPTILLSALSDPSALDQFLNVIDWTIKEVKAEQN